MRRLLAFGWAFVIAIALSALIAQLIGGRITPNTDILALLPEKRQDPLVKAAFDRTVEMAQSQIIVLIGADDWENARRAADAYRAVLAAHSDLMTLSDRIDERTQTDWLSLFATHRIGLITPEQQDALTRESPKHWTETALARLYSPVPSPIPWHDDPFGLFEGWAQARAAETPVRPREGRLAVSSEGRDYALIPISLSVPSFSMAAQEAVMPLLRDARQAALATTPDADLITAGLILHANAATVQATKEVSIIGTGSIAGIVLLMLVVFRSLKPILWMLLSIAVGCLTATVVSTLLFDRLHLLTLVFGASLIGVAMDYSLYVLCQRAGTDSSVDSFRLMRRLLPGLALTLSAAIIGYLGLALTPLPGLRQMALFSCVGLIGAWLTVVCWFPRLIDGIAFNRAERFDFVRRWFSCWPRASANIGTLAVALGFLAFIVTGLSRLTADDDIRLLQNSPAHLIADQIRLGRLLDSPSLIQFYLVEADAVETLLEREENLGRRLDALVDKGVIGGYQATSNWVPSERRQARARLLTTQRLLNPGGPLDQVADAVEAEAGWANEIREALLHETTGLTLDDYLKSPVSEPWRHLWLGRIDDSGRERYASLVSIRGLDYKALSELKAVADGLDGVRWVDRVAEISSILGDYRRNMSWVLGLAYLTVFSLLSVRYRLRAWRILFPSLIASLSALALLGLVGQSLQLFHLLALMLLLGVGIDYGIFIQENRDDQGSATGLSVALAAISTLLSFGLLGLSQTPALHAFGATMAIGILLIWLLAPCFRGYPPKPVKETSS